MTSNNLLKVIGCFLLAKKHIAKTKKMKIKILLFIGIIGLLQSCGGDDETGENVTPSTSIVNVTEITDFDAIVNVSIENAGSSAISDRGVVYGTTSNPTMADNNIAVEGSQTTFSVTINGLNAATNYFVRSYFIVDDEVAYSSSVDFITTNSCENNIFDGGIVLSNQDMVNEFGSNNYCEITGTLRISNFSNEPIIVDLSPLASISSVSGLVIDFNNHLTSLNGLENLQSTNSIDIYDNEILTDINALSNIVSSDIRLWIRENDALQNIDGLSGLTSLRADINAMIIENNTMLTNLNGLSNVVSIYGRVEIINNESLNSIEGFQSLQTVTNDFKLKLNPSLINLDGLENITSDMTLFRADNNISLVDFAALQTLLVLLN
ncbi:hypothetical protein [Patiriisocius marinus]|nr:hypothetical protein [Patiriisocius marinus]